MNRALQTAGVSPGEVTWVHAHGTGSPQNDLAEGLAIARVFQGTEAPWVSSTKWLHGHALGAAGALESVLVVRAMREGLVIATRGLKTADPRIPVRHPEGDLRLKSRHVLKNTLGFGGANAAVLFSQAGGPT
jgi:3-oxoacyl-(acyl-carrier-protein) synthase